MYCGNCGRRSGPGETFCGACGRPLLSQHVAGGGDPPNPRKIGIGGWLAIGASVLILLVIALGVVGSAVGGGLSASDHHATATVAARQTAAVRSTTTAVQAARVASERIARATSTAIVIAQRTAAPRETTTAVAQATIQAVTQANAQGTVAAQDTAVVAATQSARQSGTFTDSQTSMTVHILQATTDTQGEQFNQPRAGYVWLLLDVSIQDGDSSPHDFNPLDFAAVDEQGQTYNATVFLLNRPNLSYGAMPAGETRSGWIGFEVPNGAGTVTITWDDASTLSPPAEIARYTVS